MINKESIIPRTDPILRIAMYEVYEAKCFYTGMILNVDEYDIDHINPKNKGGKDCISNYVLCSSRINRMKNDKVDEYFIERVTLINTLLFVDDVVNTYNNIALNRKLAKGKYSIDAFAKENNLTLSQKQKLVRELRKKGEVLSTTFITTTGKKSSSLKLYADYEIMKSMSGIAYGDAGISQVCEVGTIDGRSLRP